MKKSKMYVGIGLMFSMLFASGQVAKAQEHDMSSKNHYYELKFKNNMYISAGAGINLFMTEGIAGYDNNHPITAAGSFAVGKWLSPYTGLRLEVAGAPVKLLNQTMAGVDKISGGYVGVFGDFTWNISNTIAGYNPHRIVDVIPFAGVSFMTMLKDNFRGQKPFAFPISAGTKVNFRLSHYVDLYLQGRFAFTGDRFDGRSGRQLEPMFLATGGISIKFGKNRFIAYNPYEEMMMRRELNDKVNMLRSDLEKCMDHVCPVVEEKVTIVECPEVELTSVVRFRINSAMISREQQVNVFNAAEWMKMNEDQIVEVVGFADADTGTSEYNMDLSQRRAQAVADELVNTYGIAPCRIKVVAKGSMEQPYPEHNDWNRVVIFVSND